MIALPVTQASWLRLAISGVRTLCMPVHQSLCGMALADDIKAVTE